MSQTTTLPYRVRVYENAHYMDRSESWIAGNHVKYEDALSQARTLVADCCREVEFDWEMYTLYGVDPVIDGPVPQGCEPFKAWDYAKTLCGVS